jgi:L,D-peptidoglycan transpeptidase YkuD (ErfK/YbiS/YcfS/YnhG family)
VDLLVKAAAGRTTGRASLGDTGFACALGRGGIVADKVEGDGGTPTGSFPLRQVLFRPDRLKLVETRLPCRALSPDDGWCDDPADWNYNRAISLPYRASHEKMWRADHLYDIVLVIGHNDAPVLPGKGSAVFLHLAHDDYAPTDGCVAFKSGDFIQILAAMTAADRVIVSLA